MSIDLKQLFEVVGDVRPLDETLDLSDYELFGTKPFVTPIQIQGKIENKAGVVVLNADVRFVLRVNCDRCLDEFERAFDYPVEHVLVTELNTDNDEYIVVENHLLDLDELILSDILLNLPSKLLCSEDCKGLCSMCGQNFNKGSCDCNDKLVDPRFAVLDELLK
jgi:uncharacterized protein